MPFNFASPSEMYYLALYALVVLVRYFQVKKRSTPSDPNTKRLTSQERMSVFHVGLEIVYTASGLVVLLLNDLQAYTPVILIIYLMFVITTVQTESMEPKFSQRGVFFTNIFILVVAISVTVWYFEVVYKDKHTGARCEGKLLNFRVAIPYQDFALRDHVGGATLGEKQFVYILETEATDIADAKTKAIKKSSDIPSFTSKKHPSKQPGDIVIVSEQIFVQQIN